MEHSSPFSLHPDSSVVRRIGINPGIVGSRDYWNYYTPAKWNRTGPAGRGFEDGPCIEIPAYNRVFRYARVRVFDGRACSSDDERRLVDGGGGWGRWGWLEEEWERLAENNESPSRLAATMLVHPRNIAASYRVPALEGEGVRRGTRRKPNCHGRERNKNFRPGAGLSTIEGRRTPWSTHDAFINFHPRRFRLPSRT